MPWYRPPEWLASLTSRGISILYQTDSPAVSAGELCRVMAKVNTATAEVATKSKHNRRLRCEKDSCLMEGQLRCRRLAYDAILFAGSRRSLVCERLAAVVAAKSTASLGARGDTFLIGTAPTVGVRRC
jgi:hypothetical protein